MFVCFLLAFQINHIFHSHAFILEKSNWCEVSFNGGCCKPLSIQPQTPHWRRTAYAENDYTIKGCTVALHSLSNTRHVFSAHAAQHSINGSAKCSTSLILSAGSLSLSLNKLSLMCCVTAGRQDVRAARVWVIISHFWISSQLAWLSCYFLWCGPLGGGCCPQPVFSVWRRGGRSWWQCCRSSSRLPIGGCTAFLWQTAPRNHLTKKEDTDVNTKGKIRFLFLHCFWTQIIKWALQTIYGHRNPQNLLLFKKLLHLAVTFCNMVYLLSST